MHFLSIHDLYITPLLYREYLSIYSNVSGKTDSGKIREKKAKIGVRLRCAWIWLFIRIHALLVKNQVKWT